LARRSALGGCPRGAALSQYHPKAFFELYSVPRLLAEIEQNQELVKKGYEDYFKQQESESLTRDPQPEI